LYTTGLAGDDRTLTGVTMIDDIKAAIDRSIATSGDPTVAIIPEGPYVVPRYAA
ncbi:hypothetical protein FHT86_003412, partial [Rhizobium sp. BK313]|nr:hypothetical protein [Rhizobium sp. BK313]